MDDGIYYAYIMASKPGGTIYTGVTGQVFVRAKQHKDEVVPGFTKRHHVHRLVYYEVFETPTEAIRREKQIKHYKRAWKIRLIKTTNPTCRDLGEDFYNAES